MDENTNLRQYLNLAQWQYAAWLDVPRSSLALYETDRQPLPLRAGMRNLRLLMARHGKVPTATGVADAPPSQPVPPPARQPLERRLTRCRYQVFRLENELKAMRERAAGYEARYRVLPALRAFAGPVEDPEREARWLDGIEQQAAYALLHQCGMGPQALLEARLEGLRREAEVLETMLAALPSAPGPDAPPAGG